MSENKKQSDSCPSSRIPPPCDPFTRYSQPWPRTDKDDENPFIQFRRFADESLSSFFSGFPKLLSTFQQPQRSWQDDFQREIEEHIKKTEMEEGIRKQIEQNFEEMRQAFHKQEEPKKEAGNRQTIMPPWWQASEAVKCPALKGEMSENGNKCRAMFNKEGKAKTEPRTPERLNGPWWTHGNASKCPALNDELSERARKCPAMFDKAGHAKTELDAYEYAESVSKEGPSNVSVDTAPYGWSSGLGWDGKVKKSLEQAQDHNRRSWGDRPRGAGNDQEQSTIDARNPNTHFGNRRVAVRMDPFHQPHNTIPWLVLSPYSPVYLCNPEQPSALSAQFTTSLEVPFSMQVTRYKEPSILTRDLDIKMARALPWADAFEDLISLEKNGTMVDRNASTLKTPNTWIHDMAKRGSLGPAWGFNDAGQLAQKQALPGNKVPENRLREDKAKHLKAFEPEDIVDAVMQQDGQSMLEFKRDVKALQEAFQDAFQDDRRRLELPEQPRLGADSSIPEEEGNAQAEMEKRLEAYIPKIYPFGQGDDVFLPGAIVQKQPATEEAAKSSWSSSSTTWSSHDSHNEAFSSVISTMTRTETTTLPDGDVQTTRVVNRKFSDGCEETEETVNITPSNPKTKHTMPSRMITATDKQTQTSSTPVQDALYDRSAEEGVGDGRRQAVEQYQSALEYQKNLMGLEEQNKKKFVERHRMQEQPEEKSMQDIERKRGWFWN